MSRQYGHVHHAALLRYLEEARLALLQKIGCSNDSLIASGLFLVITHIEVSYRREVKSGRYTVTCQEGRLVGRALILQQSIFSERGKNCVEASVTSVFMDGIKRRAIPPPNEFTERFEGFWGKS